MFVIQVEIEDQPPVVEEIDEQVQDVANVAENRTIDELQ